MTFSEKNRHDMQHGYRYNLGTYTALKKVLERVGPNTLVLEFDFKSFFNTVSLGAVFEQLGKYGKYLAYTVSNMIATDTVRTFNGFQDEREYVKIEGNVYRKNGMPQGLSISPVLSTLVLENETTPKDIVMYADDGLYFRERGEKDLFRR